MKTQANGNGAHIENLVVMPEATRDAGALIWWRLSGEVDAERLRIEWLARGLSEDLLPEYPSAESALRRAVHKQATPHRLVRPMGTTGTWAIVTETVGTDSVAYSQECIVRLQANGYPTCEPSSSYTDEHPMVKQIIADYERHLSVLTQHDISGWLVKMTRKLSAVALRDTGGVYFVPRNEVPSLDLMRSALREASGSRIDALPCVTNDAEHVEGILAAVEREAAEAIAKMDEELAVGDLGGRALETRAVKAASISKKVALYERVLGASLDALRARLDDLEATIAAAALAADDQVGP